MMRSRYTSAGSEAVSPAAGIANRASGCCGDDFVCLDLDSGGSVAIGHLDHRVPDGARVGTAQYLGTVAWPGPTNGNYAHIHVQAHAVAGCMASSNAIPFDQENGFRFACTPDLSYSGDPNQYSGMPLARCPTQIRADSIDGDHRVDRHRAHDGRSPSSLTSTLSQLIDQWLRRL